ncbi:hypothetical protein FV242_18995 [Methylobacterium sp. WL64]|uniref:hypothetical protein n=1 Tax=Methylobacterium sp. WL64 TaxID=2603894 RepID=UPI0011CC1F67|nr:hypothetical protein [Methylobacterium sp. WL64]TXN01309.1 hypothetical protein FV242_18995 [Methylobacterium sp. WL64]
MHLDSTLRRQTAHHVFNPAQIIRDPMTKLIWQTPKITERPNKMQDDKTAPIIDPQGLLALEKTVAQIKADHPSTTLIGLWHGQGEGSARYIEAAKNAGFTMHLSTTENELAENIGTIEGITLALIVQDFIPKSIRGIITAACEKYDPFYFIHISSCFGIDPETHHRSIITSFCSDASTDSLACKRVSDATYKAFDTANADALGIDERSLIDLDDLFAAITRRSKIRTE